MAEGAARKERRGKKLEEAQCFVCCRRILSPTPPPPSQHDTARMSTIQTSLLVFLLFVLTVEGCLRRLAKAGGGVEPK